MHNSAKIVSEWKKELVFFTAVVDFWGIRFVVLSSYNPTVYKLKYQSSVVGERPIEEKLRQHLLQVLPVAQNQHSGNYDRRSDKLEHRVPLLKIYFSQIVPVTEKRRLKPQLKVVCNAHFCFSGNENKLSLYISGRLCFQADVGISHIFTTQIPNWTANSDIEGGGCKHFLIIGTALIIPIHHCM